MVSIVPAAVAGMAIVFAFLAGLSLLMVAIRATDRLRPSRAGGSVTGAPRGSGSPAPRGGRSEPSPPVRDVPVWAIAAAALYLERERESESRDAAVWVTGRRGRRPA